ncbi:NADH-quinone oxidoreductase subunit J family protein [Penaeicola halotolerans]|uniref:NADH-quinone oxidoreductase subunit J family protein n=1 Tax=Penaeicola halotolerans TaxID=2793196 RepID=UPI001CF7F3BB|nr:NADH-quinone oxidoreductase subunit J [Penaeicola halotolerans]
MSDMITIAFYLFAGLSIISGIFMIFTKNILYAAFALMFCFLSLAGIYVLLGADFVAITQLLVYVGGVLVLLIFGVMLTVRVEGKSLQTGSHLKWGGALIGILWIGILVQLILQVDWTAVMTDQPIEASVNSIGKLLLSKYVIVFELAGLLLLIGLVGAAYIAGAKIRTK